jgi:hypothetical protein
VSPRAIGSLDSVTRIADALIIASGWAIDPARPFPTSVVVSVDGVELPPVVAEELRGDVADVFPTYGFFHGFAVPIVARPGPHLVCVAALNADLDRTPLGCQSA